MAQNNSSFSFKEKAAIEIAKGLVATGVEGPYDTLVLSAAGDYPSIGCSCWEGIRADTIFKELGLSEYAGRSFSSLSDSDKSKIKLALGSEKGQQVQWAILSKDTAGYVDEILKTVTVNNIRSLIYLGIWCPTSTYSVVRHAAKFSSILDDLDKLNSAFVDAPTSYALTTSGLGTQYEDGYRNRGNRTLAYCKALKEDEMGRADTRILENIKNSVAAFGDIVAGASSAANMTVSVSSRPPHGKHTDTIYKSPEKLYCEPIYDDLVWVNSSIPDTVMENVVSDAKSNRLVTASDLAIEVPKDTLIAYSGSNYANFTLSNEQAIEERNRAFDFNELTKKFKVPNGGKPANDKDPFPVDSKIKELEEHAPRVKISSIKSCPEALPVTKECIKLSINVERRLVRLENNMATIMRYLWRMAARMPINCVYYGGQSIYDKYRCIRCLKDNRVEDGAVFTFDQCMNCTRYEPIIGQVYEILNDSGINLAEVMDEMQLGYMTADDYIAFAKPDKLQQDSPIEKNIGAASVNSRNNSYADSDFSDQWTSDMGVKMDWNLVPVEKQKPSINGAAPNLSSNLGTQTNSGYKMVSNQSEDTNTVLDYTKLIESKNKLDALDETHFGCSLVKEADEWLESYGASFIDDMNRNLSENVAELLKQKKMEYLDNLLVCAIVCASGRSANLVISDLENTIKAMKAKSVDNIVLTVLFHDLDMDNLFGSGEDEIALPIRLDKVTKVIEEENSGGE